MSETQATGAKSAKTAAGGSANTHRECGAKRKGRGPEVCFTCRSCAEGREAARKILEARQVSTPGPGDSARQ